MSTNIEDDKTLRIEGAERIHLRGFGITYLRRLFNKESLVIDDDPIYEEVVHFAVAIAIITSKVIRRSPPLGTIGHPSKVPQQFYGRTEYWRIMTSSEMLFSGITLNRKEIDSYVKQLTGVRINEMALPPTVRRHYDSINSGDGTIETEDFMSKITLPMSWILAFAQVVDLESCSHMPLRYIPLYRLYANIQVGNGIEPIYIIPQCWYKLIISLMGNTESGDAPQVLDESFLYSHCGWSVFYNSIGDRDPGNINCDLLPIKKGVPTSTRTNERKYQIADAPGIYPHGGIRKPKKVDLGESYLPRCLSPVLKRTEQYSSRGRDFLLTIRYDIDESGAPLWKGEKAKFSVYASYSQFQRGLWEAIKTLACPHPKGGIECVKLHLGVVTARGFSWDVDDNFPDRVCILLVKGDAKARWLAVAGMIGKFGRRAFTRQVMLRCEDCCEDCAVRTANAMPGNWLVIL